MTSQILFFFACEIGWVIMQVLGWLLIGVIIYSAVYLMLEFMVKRVKR